MEGTEIWIEIDREQRNPDEFEFNRWLSAPEDLEIANRKAERTCFTMPDEAVKVEAKFLHLREITVHDGTTYVEGEEGGIAKVGQTVTVKADEIPGLKFDHWTVDSENVTLTTVDEATGEATFEMVNEPVELTAHYKAMVTVFSVPAKFSEDTGEESVTEWADVGEMANITAEIDEATFPGMVFDYWEIVTPADLKAENIESQTIEFKVPKSEVKLVAHWKSDALNPSTDPDAPLDPDFDVDPVDDGSGAGGAGAAILAGGRYNALCAKFGRDLPAGGFGIDVESVAESLQGASRPEVATRRDTVRIALTKGRLEKKTLALLKDAGYDISELEAGTRKLIFTLPDSGVEIVLSKAADVITYVEHGVCDMGVVGKDTIMEKGGSFYEMVDLGFGRCRFALATKKGKDVYGGYKTPVIATKYPAVTKAFFNRKNMDVETIKIEGSVELAPLLELADAIVDIVETGTTLKENGLEVIEDVAPISARVIVNLASAKMKKTAIQKVIAELEKGLEK